MYAKKYKEFTKATSKIPKHPKIMGKDEVKFISRMVRDELEELAISTELVDQVDAFVDIICYLLDSAWRSGVDLDPIFDIVLEANLQKIQDGKVIKDSAGKILKPTGWDTPEGEIKKELLYQNKCYNRKQWSIVMLGEGALKEYGKIGDIDPNKFTADEMLEISLERGVKINGIKKRKEKTK